MNMRANKPLRQRNVGALVLGVVAAWMSLLTFVERAEAIPVFSRKYQTSCITCHTIFPQLNPFGEAFRRNGYQFPDDDETLVKEEPVKLGIDAYKEMFPRAIWPSTLPSIPAFSVFALGQSVVNLNPNGTQKNWDLNAPSDIELVGAGTLGKDISTFWDLAFTPQDGASVGRVFVQFSNLFSWDTEDDADGARKGGRFMALPPRALNLRVGRIDPAVLPHNITEESVAQYVPLTTSFSLGQTGFNLFAEQPAIEINGIIQQYWSYAVGIANGGSSVALPSDDNTFKDVYFRVARRWYGFPMDGRLGQSVPGSVTGAQTKPANESPDDYEPTGLDYWKWWLFETGVYGWFGKSNIPLTSPITGSPTYDPNDPSTFSKDRFERIGVDARLWQGNVDIYGNAFVGHDPFPGFLQNNISLGGPTDHAGFFIETDYQWNAWAMAFLRYEQIKIYNGGFSGQEQARVVPGAVLALRQNLRLSSEVYINTQHLQAVDPNIPSAIPQSTAQWITTLWFAF
jgi:hypothetical protein